METTRERDLEVGAVLKQHELSQFTHAVLEFCDRFDGWRMDMGLVQIDLDFEARDQVIAALHSFEKRATLTEFADILSKMDCLTWHARSASERWNPIEESYLAFKQRATTKTVAFQGDTEYPKPHATLYWFLGRCYGEQALAA